MVRIPFTSLGGNCLNINKIGKGPAILLLHGFTGSSKTWESLIELLADKYSLITVDILGHGLADAPLDSKYYRMAETIGALEEVLDYFDVSEVIWLGYSMGARIALSAAVSLSNLTRGLIMESGSPGLQTQDERSARKVQDEALAGWMEKVSIEDFVDYWQSIPLWKSQEALSDEARQKLMRQRLMNSKVGLANSLRGVGTGAQPHLHGNLGEIKSPTLLIAGEYDSKYVEIAHDMMRSLVNGTISIEAGAGHAVHLEKPDNFQEVIVNFLGRIT